MEKIRRDLSRESPVPWEVGLTMRRVGSRVSRFDAPFEARAGLGEGAGRPARAGGWSPNSLRSPSDVLKGTRLPPIPLVCLPPALLSVLSSSSSTRSLPARWPMISARSSPCPPAAPPRLSPVTESVFTRGTCAPRQRPIRRSPAHSAALPSCQNSIRRGGDDDSAASYPSQRRGARWSSSSAVSSSGFCDCRCSRSSIFQAPWTSRRGTRRSSATLFPHR